MKYLGHRGYHHSWYRGLGGRSGEEGGGGEWRLGRRSRGTLTYHVVSQNRTEETLEGEVKE